MCWRVWAQLTIAANLISYYTLYSFQLLIATSICIVLMALYWGKKIEILCSVLLPVSYERRVVRHDADDSVLKAHTYALRCRIELQTLIHWSIGLAKSLLMTQRGNNIGNTLFEFHIFQYFCLITGFFM